MSRSALITGPYPGNTGHQEKLESIHVAFQNLVSDTENSLKLICTLLSP